MDFLSPVLTGAVGAEMRLSGCVGWIQEVAGSRVSISRTEYDELKPDGAPAARTLTRWAGKSWSALCADAGKRPGKTGPSPWSTQAKIEALRAAAAALDPGDGLTLASYGRWRAKQSDSRRYPAKASFGDADTWLDWCRQAGLEGAVSCRHRRYHDLGMLEYLIAAGGGSPRLARSTYNRYRRRHNGVPHSATIVLRYGSWAQAQAAAVDLLAAQQQDPGRGQRTAVPAQR